ncbi:MAG TPA: c-type cytochrome [Candidatus Limnocylindria bacterium]|nr:c-type cytochrome [Candidatus Limnocylindria bacterium]
MSSAASFRLLALVLGLAVARPGFAAVDDRTRVALEALGRLKGANLEANPGLKQAVLRVLEQVRGEPEFVTVVRDFNLPGQEAGLAGFVAAQPKSPAAVDALRLLLAQHAGATIQPLLDGPPERTVEIVQALGQTGDSQAVALLLPLVSDAKSPVAVRRAAVSALAKSNDGATGLLALAKADQLPEDVKFVAGTELRGVRWAPVRAEAEKLFPAPAAKGDQSLPPVSELMKMAGDPAKGAAVFRRADVGCINCHQVNGEGTDFGPKLSEIGAKLGKEALCEAVLDPSAGISFGFEAWNVKLKNGDEALGLIVSETEEDLSLKAVGGTVTRYRKAEITGREKQVLSIMPVGLQQNMTTQDFVDLIAYLASLRPAPK